jgi:chemotaxis protein MotB
MRAQAKRVKHEEEEESAFVSMTDMTVGFLFIMMILLAFFASQTQETDTVPRLSLNEMTAQRDDWRAKAENLAARITELESQLKTATAEIMDLRDQLARMTKERDELLAKVTELTTQNTALTQRVAELEAEVKDLAAQIAAKDDEIAKLKEQLAKLKQVDPLEAYLAQVSQARREVLIRLRDAILRDFPDLKGKVELSEESDALRFQGEGLFVQGSAKLTGEKKIAIVSRLAERLDEILPCFTLGPDSRFDESCNPAFAMVEAVQIEGHTDSSGSDLTNRNLSTARANETFFTMTRAAEGLRQHLNLKEQPVLSVAAYGPDRPVATNDTVEGSAMNRRIDLRFIMVTPRDTGGIELIRNAFDSLGEPAP